MKNIAALWLLLLLAGACTSPTGTTRTERDSIAERQEQLRVLPGSDLYKMGISRRAVSLRDTYYEAVIRFDVVHKDDKVESRKFSFDDKGNLTNINYYDDDGDLDLREIYQYNETGKLWRINQFYGDGELRTRTTCHYDQNGVMDYATRRDEDGDFEARMLYKYNEQGRVSQMSVVDDDGDLDIRYTYHYDPQGNLIRKNEYDDDGDLDETRTWYYTMDESGNWTSCIEYVDGEPYRVVIRSATLPDPVGALPAPE